MLPCPLFSTPTLRDWGGSREPATLYNCSPRLGENRFCDAALNGPVNRYGWRGRSVSSKMRGPAKVRGLAVDSSVPRALRHLIETRSHRPIGYGGVEAAPPVTVSFDYSRRAQRECERSVCRRSLRSGGGRTSLPVQCDAHRLAHVARCTAETEPLIASVTIPFGSA